MCSAKNKILVKEQSIPNLNRKNGVQEEYTYTADGLRAGKKINNVYHAWTWDGSRLVSDGLDTYYYGKGLISSSSGNYYVPNAHGDVTALTNGAGEITKTYAYDPFGAEKNIDPADSNPFRYCSEYYDKGIDKIYLRARTYDPTLGRFTQQDPACDGFNWYIYCSNNPIAFCDITGLKDVLVRYAIEKNGGTVSYDSETNTTSATLYGKTITFDLNTGAVMDGDQEIGKCKVINGRVVTDSEILQAGYNLKTDQYLIHKPGDGFATLDDAAIAWGGTYNEESINVDLEYLSAFYYLNGKWTFSEPATGDSHSVEFFIPDYSTKNWIHSHGAYSPGYDNEYFSIWSSGPRASDISSATTRGFDSFYLVTPGGYIKRYDVASGRTITVGKGVYSDPNSPVK